MRATTRQYLYIFVPVMALGWTLFKCCYPYADFFTDSYTYIEAAADHSSIGYRPIGYSVFLRLVHALTVSDTVLVTVQYILVQASCLCLFFFLRRHYRLTRWAEMLLAAFIVLDPLVYYTSNYVSSDALFFALSLFWLTLLLQLVRRPDWQGLVLQWILLALIFYTRYVALSYPVVAAFTFLLVRRDLRYKVTAIAGSVAIVVAGAWYTRALTRQQTGAAVFSAFSGWQLANNALHIYPWMPVDTAGVDTTLTRYVTAYFDKEGAAIRQRGPEATTAYMWIPGSPLHAYFNAYRKKHSLLYFTAWNRVAPLYTQYGYTLLRRHPAAFARYYLWPSAGSFFIGELDVFAIYNEGHKDVDSVAQHWFHYRSTRVRVWSATAQATLLAPFPWIFFLLNLVFAGMVVWCIVRRRQLRSRYPELLSVMQVVGAYLFINACFNIFASPSVFRYQVLPLTLLLFVICLFLSKLLHEPARNT